MSRYIAQASEGALELRTVDMWMLLITRGLRNHPNCTLGNFNKTFFWPSIRGQFTACGLKFIVHISYEQISTAGDKIGHLGLSPQ